MCRSMALNLQLICPQKNEGQSFHIYLVLYVHIRPKYVYTKLLMGGGGGERYNMAHNWKKNEK